MLVSILYCKTMYCYRLNLPNMFITSDTEMNWDQQCVTVWYQEDSALKQADVPYSSPRWTRWMINRAWWKAFAIHDEQESRFAKIVEHIFKTHFLVQFIARSKVDCNFTRQGPMPSSSMTHCLRSSLRKRCAWKLKNSFIKGKAQDHVFCSKQIRNVNHKCKYHSSNDVFLGAKRVQNNYRKSYDELLQHDNKMRIWTRSEKPK